ncbi:MAG: hypothetical protein N2652_07645 [Kiritimatiellae bacterium]|nr:hypothetical protein [Kiritimatiellia bacterium]
MKPSDWRRRWIPMAATCIGLTGCATTTTVPGGPSAPVGRLEETVTNPPLAVALSSKQVRVRRGEPIPFEVVIQNVSPQTIWLPKEPTVVLVWTYPTGQRDNTMTPMVSQVSLGREALLELPPGETVARQVIVSSRYFPRLGVTKFQAIVQVPSNTVAIALPTGRYNSNRFGVFVTE